MRVGGRQAQDQDALAPQVGGSGRDTCRRKGNTAMHRPVSTTSVKRVVRVVFPRQEQTSLRSEVLASRVLGR